MKSQRRADSANIIASLVIGGGIFTCLFLAFSWGNSLLRQAAIEQNLTAFYRENARLEKENEEFLQRFRYLESEQYRDKWAKENKGLARPGEKVIIVEYEPSIPETIEEDQAAVQREILLLRPKREQWKMLFFGSENTDL